jgi:hypothetical protein
MKSTIRLKVEKSIGNGQMENSMLQGKYTPHAPKPAIKKLDAAQVGVGLDKTEAVDNPKVSGNENVPVPGSTEDSKDAVAGTPTEAEVVEGSAKA